MKFPPNNTVPFMPCLKLTGLCFGVPPDWECVVEAVGERCVRLREVTTGKRFVVRKAYIKE